MSDKKYCPRVLPRCPCCLSLAMPKMAVVEKLIMYILLDYKPTSNLRRSGGGGGGGGVRVDLTSVISFVGTMLARFWRMQYRDHTMTNYGHSPASLVALTGDYVMATQLTFTIGELWMQCQGLSPTSFDRQKYYPMEVALQMLLLQPSDDRFRTFVVLAARSGVGRTINWIRSLDGRSAQFQSFVPFYPSVAADGYAIGRIRMIESYMYVLGTESNINTVFP